MDQSQVEFLQTFSYWYTAASTVATVLVMILPPPMDIEWKPYTIVFGMIQRLSIHRPAYDADARARSRLKRMARLKASADKPGGEK